MFNFTQYFHNKWSFDLKGNWEVILVHWSECLTSTRRLKLIFFLPGCTSMCGTHPFYIHRFFNVHVPPYYRFILPMSVGCICAEYDLHAWKRFPPLCTDAVKHGSPMSAGNATCTCFPTKSEAFSVMLGWWYVARSSESKLFVALCPLSFDGDTTRIERYLLHENKTKQAFFSPSVRPWLGWEIGSRTTTDCTANRAPPLYWCRGTHICILIYAVWGQRV